MMVQNPIAIFTVEFSYLHHSDYERGCEAILGNLVVYAQSCLTSMFKYTVIQMRKGETCEEGYCIYTSIK